MKKNESKNNRKRRRILLAFIMILFTGIILTASTYAWFYWYNFNCKYICMVYS